MCLMRRNGACFFNHLRLWLAFRFWRQILSCPGWRNIHAEINELAADLGDYIMKQQMPRLKFFPKIRKFLSFQIHHKNAGGQSTGNVWSVFTCVVCNTTTKEQEKVIWNGASFFCFFFFRIPNLMQISLKMLELDCQSTRRCRMNAASV